MESDINCIVDGELTVGEAKSEHRLAKTAAKEKEVAERYLSLARSLNASRVIFATLQAEWRKETASIITDVFALQRQRVTFLTAANLYSAE